MSPTAIGMRVDGSRIVVVMDHVTGWVPADRTLIMTGGFIVPLTDESFDSVIESVTKHYTKGK